MRSRQSTVDSRQLSPPSVRGREIRELASCRLSTVDCRLLVPVLLTALTACATMGRPPELRGAAAAGWQRVIDGGAANWGDAADPASLFGRASVAFERGELA